jgi:hypothetical protein
MFQIIQCSHCYVNAVLHGCHSRNILLLQQCEGAACRCHSGIVELAVLTEREVHR